ncbi:MAG TPA: double zinc ribbon domain-containing protein [Capillimicrobium sp.]|nr:double zinc ribbon domain-containing protein [Capillimicrobium sp.]
MPLTAPYRLLLAVVAPPSCPACGAALAGTYDALCPACARELPWLGRAVCPRCALPSPCDPCPAAARAWERAWAPFAHDGPARALVAALKFRGLTAAAELLAAPLAAGAAPLLAGATLVPVPADRGRRRRRGFDHAALIADALGRRAGRPVAACLRREGGGRQLGAGRAARLAGAARARVVARGPVPARAVVVDDVHTTGATLDACARALRAAGAAHVDVLTATRAIRR